MEGLCVEVVFVVVVVEPERSEGVRCFTSRRRQVTKWGALGLVECPPILTVPDPDTLGLHPKQVHPHSPRP